MGKKHQQVRSPDGLEALADLSTDVVKGYTTRQGPLDDTHSPVPTCEN